MRQADPADRLTFAAGDQTQCDLWFPPVKIPLGAGQTGSPPVLVMVSSYSRFITAVMLPSRRTEDLLAEMWQLLSTQLLAVPHRLIWDNEAGIGRGNHFAAGVSAFTGILATKCGLDPPGRHPYTDDRRYLQPGGIRECIRSPGSASLYLVADATYSTGTEFIIDGGFTVGQVLTV